MLSRRWASVVVVGWLLLTGWFVLREYQPQLAPAEPTPFAVTIGDEPRISLTGAVRQRLIPVTWQVYRNIIDNSAYAGYAEVRVQYDQWSDGLEFQSEFKLRSGSQRRLGSSWLEVDTTFRVDWEGRLQEVDAEMRLRREPLLLTSPYLVAAVMGAWLPGLTEHVQHWPFLRPPTAPGEASPLTPAAPSALDPGRPRTLFEGARGIAVAANQPLSDSSINLYMDQEVAARYRARVRHGKMLPLWRVTGEQREPQFQPMELSPRGHVLVPFQPLNRMPGLVVGQRWRVPLIDLEAAVRPDRTRELRHVIGEVAETSPIIWHRQLKVPVYLVTYRDAVGEVIRAWVRQRDLLVLRQEIHFSGDRYILERGPDR